MKLPASKFDEFVVWQKAHRLMLQSFYGLFAGHSEFWPLNSVYLSSDKTSIPAARRQATVLPLWNFA
jgi:hypothetical protein